MPKQFEHWVTQPLRSDMDKHISVTEEKEVKFYFSQSSTLTVEQIDKLVKETYSRYKVRNN